ncbi:MAG: ACP S-malonyltransferase [Alphaproteobacteria bacterium]
MSIVLNFPGQGSQSVGMGSAFYDQFYEARLVLEEAEDVLQQDLKDLIFNGPKDKLTQTINTQPAVFIVSMMMFKVLQKEIGESLLEKTTFAAGHSFGEYTALCAAGSLSIKDAVRLISLRGKAMQTAFPPGEGGMSAVILLDVKDIEECLKNYQKRDNLCVIANDNCPGQIVISGYKSSIQDVMPKLIDKGAKRVIPLDVSGPFHTPLMQGAAYIMEEGFRSIDFKKPFCPVISNVTARPIKDITETLVKQITNRVRWREGVLYMIQKGASHFVEIGPGNVLTGINRRISSSINAFNINEPSNINSFVEILK